MLNTSDRNVLSWLRQAEGNPAVIIACNFTANPQTVSFDLSSNNIAAMQATTLLKTPGVSDPSSVEKVDLPPFGVYIGQLQ